MSNEISFRKKNSL